MKKMVNYPELWQKKRNELPVDGDPNADWLQMRSVLDELMPVSNIKKPYDPKGLKWIYKLLITFSAAVIIFGGVQLYLAKQHTDPVKSVPQKINPVIPVQTPTHPALVNQIPNKPISNAVITKGSNPVKIPLVKPTINAGKDSAAALKSDKELLHRDSSALPLNLNAPKPVYDSLPKINKPVNPGILNGKTIQNAHTDSLKKVKKKKRRIGIFT